MPLLSVEKWGKVYSYILGIQTNTIVGTDFPTDEDALAVEAMSESTFYRGSNFPECSGNESRLNECFTIRTENETHCNHVLVNCNVEENTNVRQISLWMILSVAIVITMSVLIIVIVISLVAVVYSRWKTTYREKHTPTTSESPPFEDSHCATVTVTVPESSYPPLQSADDSDNNTLPEREIDSLSVEETPESIDQSRHPSFLSETTEHHLINPLYGETDEPPTFQTTQEELQLNSEPHYDIPYASPPADCVGGLSDALRHHKYEYIDNSVAKP